MKKNGTTAGHVSKTFYDGLGRTIQTCGEVDPSTNGGSRYVCSTMSYDRMGREEANTVPFYVQDVTSYAVGTPSHTQYTFTIYDALGRCGDGVSD